jgi:uncharacterized protein YbjQ (UPF0145 family)
VNEQTLNLLINLGIPAVLIVGAFFIGSWIERRHFRRIRQREGELRDVMAFAIRRAPDDLTLSAPHLVTGSAVISVDYFKQFAAGLRGIVGGRIGSYESLFERARREAIVRMKETARRGGSNIVLNVKLDTTRIYAGAGGATVSVEAVAYGTAYRRPDEPA